MHLLALTFRSSASAATASRRSPDMANGWTSDGTSVLPDLRDGRETTEVVLSEVQLSNVLTQHY